jgi:hypothetical protein
MKNRPQVMPTKRWRGVSFGGKLEHDNKLYYAQKNYKGTRLLPFQVKLGVRDCTVVDCGACIVLNQRGIAFTL